MNAVSYKAEGISFFDALQVQVHKRYSNGLQFTTSYTWSHSLDEQSGLGLFFTGNNRSFPWQTMDPRISIRPTFFWSTTAIRFRSWWTAALAYLVNGWTVGGQTVAQSGQPYSVYDYSGSVASLYYGTSNDIGNPIVPLVPGATAKQATKTGYSPRGNCGSSNFTL